MSLAFDAKRWWPAPLLPREDGRDWTLLFVVATLSFLASLAAIAVFAGSRAAHGWRSEIAGSATVIVSAQGLDTPDAAAARAAEVELLITTVREQKLAAETEAELRSSELEEAHGELAQLREQVELAEAHSADLREQVETAQSHIADLQAQLEAAIQAPPLPPEAAEYERELVELRGALERAQNRSRLHRAHAGELESELTQVKQELTTLRGQFAAGGSLGGRAGSVSESELENLREQVAYGEALAADLEWQLEEARANEEAAQAGLAMRIAEVELLSVTLRDLHRPADATA